MSGVTRVGDLEIGEDVPFMEREWRLERIGWTVFALFLLAALLGLLGPGPLSGRESSDSGGSLAIRYERFGHYQAPFDLRVEIGAEGTRAETLRLWLDQRYLAGVEIERVTPQPDSVRPASDRHVFEFEVFERGRPVTITFHLQAQRSGSLDGRAGLVDGPEVAFTQFFYP